MSKAAAVTTSFRAAAAFHTFDEKLRLWSDKNKKQWRSCTDGGRWALLYKVTSIPVWLHVDEGEGRASCPAGEWGRRRVSIRHHLRVSFRKSRLTFTSCVSYIRTRVHVRFDNTDVKRWWLGITTWAEQDLQSQWMTCYLYCTLNLTLLLTAECLIYKEWMEEWF